MTEEERRLSQHIFSGYDKGYWRACLDLKNCLENHDDYFFKSKKQYKRFIISLLDYLLCDNMFAAKFREMGGECNIVVSTKKENYGEVINKKDGGDAKCHV